LRSSCAEAATIVGVKAPARLRRLGVSTLAPQGRVALFDPLGVSPSAREGGLVLDEDEWRIAQAFDGSTTLAELVSAGPRSRGEGRDGGAPEHASAGIARVQALAERLSRENLLEDEHFERSLAREFETFRRSERRAASGAGSEYPADPFDLRLRLGGVVADDWDMPPLAGVAGLWAPGGPLPAAAALHGRAWAAVRHSPERFERVVLLGSVGAPLEHVLVPLAKSFDTPLGPLEVDREALAFLGVLPGRAQIAHRATNVLERQALFVRLLFPRAAIVPILVGGLDPDREPASDARFAEALEALGRLAYFPGTLFVAAADLYHQRRPSGVGPIAAGARVAETDRRQVRAVEDLDAAAFAAAALEDGDGARTAQAGATYLLLALLAERAASAGVELTATNLGYLQCPTPSALFTTGAAVFHRGPAT
jgi:AmmeMemoRadiSam system protein B